MRGAPPAWRGDSTPRAWGARAWPCRCWGDNVLLFIQTRYFDNIENLWVPIFDIIKWNLLEDTYSFVSQNSILGRIENYEKVDDNYILFTQNHKEEHNGRNYYSDELFEIFRITLDSNLIEKITIDWERLNITSNQIGSVALTSIDFQNT